VYFDNTVCVSCGYRLGYLPERFVMSALEPDGGRWKALAVPDLSYVSCANSQYNAAIGCFLPTATTRSASPVAIT
jgi:hypothetical protein